MTPHNIDSSDTDGKVGAASTVSRLFAAFQNTRSFSKSSRLHVTTVNPRAQQENAISASFCILRM